MDKKQLSIRQKLQAKFFSISICTLSVMALSGIVSTLMFSSYYAQIMFDVIALIVTASASYVLISRTSSQIAAPIASLSHEAEYIASNWELDRELPAHDDELAGIVNSFNSLTFTLKEYMQDFGSMVGANQMVSAELNVASKIQADMLPKLFPPFPERKEFDIYASMTPAKEVGGDFYDFFMIDDDHLALVIADVSDKGVPAALFMVIAKTLIKNRVQMGGSPSEILADVNNQLHEGNDEMLFVTVWLGILELSTGKLTASNAGHEHPAICMGGKFTIYEADHDPAIAVMPDLEFTEHEFMLKPGDCIYVYTDGVSEANNPDNELFGTDRMIEVLNKYNGGSAKDILLSMREAVEEFVKKAPQSDDITMLCLKYRGIY